MIKLLNICKTIEKRSIINNLSLEIRKGEKLVLLGPSGSGKTTLLKIINGLISPTSGSVIIDGADIKTIKGHELRRKIGYVMQHFGLFPHYTVKENVAIVPKLLGWGKEKTDQRTRQLFQKLELEEGLLHRLPAQLSGGQQQRVGLARALAADPDIILMDEPFGALDPITRANIRRELKALDDFREKTMVMVTHDVTEAFEMGTRICVVQNGEIKQVGTPQQLLFSANQNSVFSFIDGNRAILEMKVLTLADVLAFIVSPKVTTKITQPLSSHLTILEVISQPLKDEGIFIQTTDGNVIQTSKEAILSAFYKKINTLRKNDFALPFSA